MMRRILSSFIIVSVFFALPVASMAFPSGDNGPEWYEVNVKSSFGTEFVDCYHFFPDGTLVIELGPPSISAPQKPRSRFRWQSVDTVGSGLAFNGSKSLFGLHATGLNSGGDTFILKGKRVKECSIFATADDAASGNPYQQ